MLFADRVHEALDTARRLADADDLRIRLDARIIAVAALIDLDRTEEY